MLSNFHFHHIGYAVTSIEKTMYYYIDGGYSCSSVIFDPIQNVNICFLTKEGEPMIELLEPVDENSPINKNLEKNGVCPYHCCYSVENIEDAIARLRKMRFMVVSYPAEAVALNNHRVAFLYNKDIGLIELLEQKLNSLFLETIRWKISSAQTKWSILVTKIYHIYLKIHLCICGCIKYP